MCRCATSSSLTVYVLLWCDVGAVSTLHVRAWAICVNRFVYFCVLNGCTSMCGHACLLVACMCASDLHAGRLGVVRAMHARAACAFACFCASRALRGDVVCTLVNACAHVDACGCALVCRGGGCTQAECARALKRTGAAACDNLPCESLRRDRLVELTSPAFRACSSASPFRACCCHRSQKLYIRHPYLFVHVHDLGCARICEHVRPPLLLNV